MANPVKPEMPDMAGHRNLYGLGTTGGQNPKVCPVSGAFLMAVKKEESPGKMV
jgi:hypothetical protein